MSAAVAERPPPHVRLLLLLGVRRETLFALLGIYFLLVTLYAWQAWRRETPTVFTDELELTQISRAISETGHAARRGEPYGFSSLVPWLTAPFWRIGNVATAYETIKYVQALVMALAIFPAYGLARTVVSRPWALFAAAGAIAAPALSYAPFLVEEPWAYPLATLALWLTVRAVTAPGRGTIAVAAGACVLGALTRSQLAVLLATLIVALLVAAWRCGLVRRWRSTWSAGDRVGGIVLAVGLLLGFSALMGHLSGEWAIATGFWKDRILEYGLWAGGAFAVGVGVLPVVALITTLLLPARERTRPGVEPFTIVSASAVLAFGWYAAVKGAYVSTQFSSLIVERNLIYLTPLVFVATAFVLERASPRWWAVVAAGAATLAMIVATPIDRGADSFPYYEAHGLAIVALANREWGWPVTRIDHALIVVVVLSTLLVLGVTGARRHGRRREALSAAVGVAIGVLAWNLTTETYASIGEHDFSSRVEKNLPKPNDWVDELANGGSVVMLGQRMADNPLGVPSTEFWNRSIDKVWSVDGSAPGPGPELTPDLASIDGTLTPAPDTDYVLAINGVEVAGPEVGRLPGGTATLVRIDGPIRLRSNVTRVAADGWTVGAPGDDKRISNPAYNRFDVSQDGPGYAAVSLSRETFCPDNVHLPGIAHIRVGPIRVGRDKQPAIAHVTEQETVYVPACGSRDVRLTAPDAPWRVEVDIQTFVPAEIDASSERRELGARVGFSFEPA